MTRLKFALECQTVNTIAVRSILDPSRVLTYSDERRSVLGLDATDHVLVGKDHVERPVLGLAPQVKAPWPSIWRIAAVKAVAHVLMHLVHPLSRPAMLDQHLQQDGSGEVRGLGHGEHVLLVNDERLELFDDGHALVLRMNRSRVTLP